MFTSRSRGIDRTDVWPCPGSKRTSRIVSLCGGSVRSSESLDLARRSEPSTRYVCGPPEYRSSPGGGGTLFLKISSATGVAEEIFKNKVPPPPGLLRYSGGPQTYLVLGSDRRAKSTDVLDRTDPPHSDTILLVRFDPGQGQTSVLSIPRDLLVNIKSRSGAYYPQEKINAANTYGAKFDGFIKVVDTLVCVYVNVDHRYLHINGEGGEAYSEINLQPGYQKLCYNNALSYVRYRHGDSDFVRVARQQDFLRALREQISPEDVAGQIHHVAKAVGTAIVTAGFSASADQLIQLAKLIGFSQGKPLRQVKFRAASTNFALRGGSYVTSTSAMESATLDDFLNGDQKVVKPKPSVPHPSGHG